MNSINAITRITAIAFSKGPSLDKNPQITPVVGVSHFKPAVGHRKPIRVKHGGVSVIRLQIG